MTDADISCETCCFWQRLDLGMDIGECRYRAPSPRASQTSTTSWPITTDDDWCGDWDETGDDDELVDAEFEDIIERLTEPPKRRRWWRRSAA